MCGIWADIGTGKFGLSALDSDIIKQMMVLTSLRGSDSTGIALVTDKDKRPKIAKTVGDPFFIINNPDIWKKVDDAISKDALAAFGHGRYATKGKVNTKNAHPFVHEHLTMVHNGTITYGVDYKHEGAELEVDSHALTIAIAKEGWKKLEDVGGAYAIIAHDAKDQCLYVIRNSERPLYMCKFPGRTILMSEAQAIRYLADRVPSLYTKAGPDVRYMEENMLYRFQLEDGSYEAVEKIVKKQYTQSYQFRTSHGWVSGGTEGHGKIVYAILDTIKELPGSGQKMYEYTFIDGDTEYLAWTNKFEPERIGTLAQGRVNRVVRNLASNTTEQYLQYKSLLWYDKDAKPEEVTTHNGKVLTSKDWFDIVATENCELCGGPLYAHEVENTVILTGGSVICAECVKAGRANKMGVVS